MGVDLLLATKLVFAKSHPRNSGSETWGCCHHSHDSTTMLALTPKYRSGALSGNGLSDKNRRASDARGQGRIRYLCPPGLPFGQRLVLGWDKAVVWHDMALSVAFKYFATAIEVVWLL